MAKRYLLITTEADISLPFFFEIEAKILYYAQSISFITKEIDGQSFDVVYFRDPFNVQGYDPGKISRIVSFIRKKFPKAQYVDDITCYDDLLFEDKWRQYEIFKDLMPYTKLLERKEEFNNGKHIAKKRISSRAMGIALKREEIKAGVDYILQDRINIKKEFRAYCINGVIPRQVSIQSSKTEDTRVKTKKIEKTPDKVMKLAHIVMARLPKSSFVGLDIALTKDRIFLIEVNRSPQFSKYNQLVGSNILTDYRIG